MNDDQWYHNYMEQLKENVELRKKIQVLETKLQAIQEILTGTQEPEKPVSEKSIWQKNKEEQK